jgi:AraC family transcriptional activator of pobA
MPTKIIPSFFLYGEAPIAVGDRFLHLESLDDRSRPSHWNIRPHAHADLNHIFFIAQGGGEMRADAAVIAFSAPCLLLLPARVVHGFSFETDTAGSVLTVSEAYLRDLIGRELEFAPLFAAPSAVPSVAAKTIESHLRDLARELAWTAPGHAAAVEALLVRLLVEVLRTARRLNAERPTAQGAHAELVARFRELVEERYRTQADIEAYAAALAVTPKQLRSACERVAHVSPLRILQERRLLEAKRLMLYSNMSVAEAGYYLGFGDPAYFSRFFARGVGRSPRSFRSQPYAAA